MTMVLTMLPAKDGDCLVLRWGAQDEPHHIIVDLGRSSTWKSSKKLFERLDNVELLAITHVDADHVSGGVTMFSEKRPRFSPKDVWFNGRDQLVQATRHLNSVEEFSPPQGEKITQGIARFQWPHNEHLATGPIATDHGRGGEWLELGGGARILLLSPDLAALAKMLDVWDAALSASGLRTFDEDAEETEAPRGFEAFDIVPPHVSLLAQAEYLRDTAPANCSSIAILVEQDGKRVLLAGDASSEIIERHLRPWAEKEGERIRIDLVKVSHHGARSNTSPEFLKLIDCRRFAFSSDGSRGHEHPHRETVARILANDPDSPKVLYFNYRGPEAAIWDDVDLADTWNYTAIYCADEKEGTLEITV
jgi:beta-lactamase superfamily II metal-dependent hydrolase